MSRLFISPRERNFFSDITKECIKDVIGQRIYYFPISEMKTKLHTVYQESPEKIFDQPLSIDALVDSPKIETEITEFGPDQKYTLDVWIQYRDLVDKGIEVCIGDFFSYGEIFYEITEKNITRNIYGMAEEKDGVKITGTSARESLFKSRVLGPTDRRFTDPDAVQTTFYQQRGFSENAEGTTGDRREMFENGTLERQAKRPAEISEAGDPEVIGSSYYGEDEEP